MNVQLVDPEFYKLDPDNKKYGWSDQYGSSYIAAEYCNLNRNLNPIRHHWLHGCNGPWENNHLNMYVRNFTDQYMYLVARKDQEDYLKSNGINNVKAIGLPIVYLKEQNMERIKDSVLFMPTHIRPGEKYVTENIIEEYINYIEKIAKHFRFAAVCLHSAFFLHDEFISKFKKLNIEIIQGASNQDKNALKRQKMIFQQFETLVTNGWGSHVAYGLYFGTKLSIDGPKIEKSKQDFLSAPGWEGREDVIDAIFDPKAISEKEIFLNKFYVSPLDAVPDKSLGLWLVGAENKISPLEMKEIMGWKMFSIFKLKKILVMIKFSITKQINSMLKN